LFGSCIIHILYTGCAKIKKKNNSGAKGLIGCDSSIVRSQHFPVRLLAHVCSLENKVTREDEAVSPFPNGKLWKLGHVGVCT
jgi:hypothetical protein